MRSATLEIVDGLGRRSVPLEADTATVGRGTTCDVRVVGDDVSRDHAEFVWQGTSFVIRDRGIVRAAATADRGKAEMLFECDDTHGLMPPAVDRHRLSHPQPTPRKLAA